MYMVRMMRSTPSQLAALLAVVSVRVKPVTRVFVCTHGTAVHTCEPLAVS